MSEDWKPGDVAMVERGPLWKGRALFTIQGWVDQGGDADYRPPLFDVTNPRHLVVIDPEDREQVERLRDLMDEAYEEQNSDHGSVDIRHGRGMRGNAMQTGLRRFAAISSQPKPEEPTGLGAVVEDVTGGRWIKIDVHADCNDWVDLGAHKYKPADENETVRYWYRDIAAVKVLSEGVQP